MSNQAFVIEIDLNIMDANSGTVVPVESIMEPKLRTAALPEVGEAVIAVDEWHVRYPAMVNRVDDGFLHLTIKLDAPSPGMAEPPEFEKTTSGTYPAPRLTPPNQTGPLVETH